MNNDTRKIIEQEYLKCYHDPVYFLRTYCYIQHPKRGRILFNLFPFQEKVLDLFNNNQYIITLKSRQLGISTLAAGYSLWLMLFHKDKNVLALATTQATARNLVTKVIFMYDELPKWLRLPVKEKNKLSLRLSNGSKITAKSSSTDAARSEAVSLLLIDEAAFIDNIDETFTAAQQTLATGGQCMALSTPNGIGNWFHKTWVKGQQGENSFVPVRLDWRVHPERNDEWRKQQDRDLGERMAAQECDCSFLTSGHTVIESSDLEYYDKQLVKPPIEKRGYGGDLWIWEYPNYEKKYLITADVARGDASDNSAFHIIDIEACKQVGEYKGKITPKELGNLLVAVGKEYADAVLVVENANIGWATIEQVITRKYENLYYGTTADTETVESYMAKYEKDKLVPGFSTNVRTRPLIIAKLQEFMRERLVIIQSERTMLEARVFVWKNGKPQAQTGYNDDLILSLAIGLFVRDTALELFTRGMDLTRSSLETFGNLNTGGLPPIFKGNEYNENPFELKVGNHTEDISWLLGQKTIYT
jgi:hypothetical protein